jgi:hypothetical protein
MYLLYQLLLQRSIYRQAEKCLSSRRTRTIAMFSIGADADTDDKTAG